VLEDGRITAIGSHEELLTNSPTYQRLYHLQFMDMPESRVQHGLDGDALVQDASSPEARGTEPQLLEPALSGEGED
jgi:hypothetical protein